MIDHTGLVVLKLEESAKTLLTPGTLFEELGFRYVGPVEGHDVEDLVEPTLVGSGTDASVAMDEDGDIVLDVLTGTLLGQHALSLVIITYLVSSDSEVRYNESPLSQGYSSDVDNKVSATLISTRGRTSRAEIVTLKNDLYDADDKSLVWTAQTRTVAPKSIDEVVTDVTELLIDRLIDDGILKE